MKDMIQKAAERIAGAQKVVALTGAGISVDSGIPDFRSPGGVWARHKPVMYDDFIRSRAERVRYWEMRKQFYRECAHARPNDGHRVIARLEELGHIVAVVTQNIDGLHQDAGSRRVLEVHGTNRIVACIGCGKEWPPEEILAMVDAGDQAPDCDECGQPLKSKTIAFGQAMPVQTMADAARLSEDADIYLAIGSSLVVEPAASLPRLAKHHGAALLIVNKTPTPLDAIADLVIREGIGATMLAVLEKCDPESVDSGAAE